MMVATECFFEPLEAWAKAVREQDFAGARHHAERLLQSGEMLAFHPEFRRALTERCPGVEPRDFLVHMSQFLVCATDGRARVLVQQVESKQAARAIEPPLP